MSEKTFAMSMYASEKDLFKAKAEYFEAKYRDTAETLRQLEIKALELSRTNDALVEGNEDLAARLDRIGELADELERRLSRHEAD